MQRQGARGQFWNFLMTGWVLEDGTIVRSDRARIHSVRGHVGANQRRRARSMSRETAPQKSRIPPSRVVGESRGGTHSHVSHATRREQVMLHNSNGSSDNERGRYGG